jgi:C1A family cysteine protease
MIDNYLETDYDYPYSAASFSFGVTPSCTANQSLGVIHTNKNNPYIYVGQDNGAIISAINNGGPVSVAIDASSTTVQSYTGGIITSGCGTTLNQAVLVVGYGTDTTTGQEYFVVRNSWGTSWGMSGFAYFGQSPTGTAPGVCGLNTDPYYPVPLYIDSVG